MLRKTGNFFRQITEKIIFRLTNSRPSNYIGRKKGLNLKYQCDNIRSEGITLEGTLGKGWLESQPRDAETCEITNTSPVTYTIHLSRSGTTVFVTGVVTATVELPCSRCLEPFDFPVTSEFSFSLVPEVPETRPSEKELQPEDLETDFYDGETIDVGKIVQNNVLLSLPIKPLCGEDCQGLCSRCGTNKNLATCTCSTEEPGDPRLARLKDFFSE